jgi:hypothetical protein
MLEVKNSPPAPLFSKREGSEVTPLLLPREGQHKSSTYFGGYDLSTITMFSANTGNR